jgi:hypothetical protein
MGVIRFIRVRPYAVCECSFKATKHVRSNDSSGFLSTITADELESDMREREVVA